MTTTYYNVASETTQLNLGSSDSDAFNYDPNTFRMTQYQFNVNGQSVTGALTWNANGTLGKLAITDAFNSANTQTCTYSHDDLVRIASANCGSVWSQTFSYDAFGNLSKSGTQSFQPTYSYATNQMSSIGSFTPSYDTNGDVTNDSLHSYAWDAEGRPTTIDGITVTYDALKRMVEQDKSGSYTQIVYAPMSNKLALMSTTTMLTEAFAPLPAGAAAVYTSTSLGTTNKVAYYRHPDWLGSSRFSSTTTRTMYNDLAYAPFGEQYAQSGSTDVSFTGMNQDTTTNLYDFMYREYGIQGRWPSPDPAGMAAANPANPQSWNRYAYVLNNPLALIDPSGFDCVYYDDSGDAVESIDTDSNSAECGESGGDWINGTVDWWSYDPGSDTFTIGSSDGNYNYLTTANAPGTQANGVACYGDCDLSYSQFSNYDPLENFPGASGGNQPQTQGPQFQLSPQPTKPSCASVFISTAFDDLKNGVVFPFGQGPEAAATATATAGAMQYTISKGLAYPLKSKIVQRILGLGETASVAIVGIPVLIAGSKGLAAEFQANRARTCSTVFGN